MDQKTDDKYAKLLQKLCVEIYHKNIATLAQLDIVYPGAEVIGALTVSILLKEAVNKVCKDDPKLSKVVAETEPKIVAAIHDFFYGKQKSNN